MLQIQVVTLFPALIDSALRYGVLGRALTRGLLQVGSEDPRTQAGDVHRTVDDRPYGGGPGMVGRPDVWAAAIDAAHARLPGGALRVYLTAQGEPLSDARVVALARLSGLVLVAGRYEGIDERVIESRIDAEISVGDYVLSGGEFAALVVIDAVARKLPGVLGDERSAVEDSFATGRLDWPHYTRPVLWEGREVPQVLQGGNHAEIRRWRLQKALERTRARRPDLLTEDLPKVLKEDEND